MLVLQAIVKRIQYLFNSVQKWFKTNFIEPDEIKFTSPKEIFSILEKCQNNKAPGADKITNFVFEKMPRNRIIFPTKMVNSIFKLGYFLEDWKLAKIIVASKPNKNTSG